MVSNCCYAIVWKRSAWWCSVSPLFSENNAKSLSHDIIIIGLGAGGFWEIGVADGASIAGPPADYRHKDCEINPEVQTCFLINISFIPLLLAVAEALVSSLHSNVIWVLFRMRDEAEEEVLKLWWKAISLVKTQKSSLTINVFSFLEDFIIFFCNEPTGEMYYTLMHFTICLFVAFEVWNAVYCSNSFF